MVCCCCFAPDRSQLYKKELWSPKRDYPSLMGSRDKHTDRQTNRKTVHWMDLGTDYVKKEHLSQFLLDWQFHPGKFLTFLNLIFFPSHLQCWAMRPQIRAGISKRFHSFLGFWQICPEKCHQYMFMNAHIHFSQLLWQLTKYHTARVWLSNRVQAWIFEYFFVSQIAFEFILFGKPKNLPTSSRKLLKVTKINTSPFSISVFERN